jgi:hypothetical protein
MAGDQFNIDTVQSKLVLNPDGTELGPGPAETHPPTPGIATYSVSVREAKVKQSDVQRTFAGPGAGTPSGSGQATHPADSWGYTSPVGNKIAINGISGAETIELIHHTGASILLDTDGAIFIVPSGRKGFGLNATNGDGVVAAQNKIVIKGGSGITLETDGDMELNVGKHLFMDVGGDFHLGVKGATTIQSDGTMAFEAVKDLVQTVGSIKRTTVAGDMRQQVNGEYRIDSGKRMDLRTDSDFSVNAKKTFEILGKEDSVVSVDTGKITVYSEDDATVGSKGSMYVVSRTDVSISATTAIAIRAVGNIIQQCLGSNYIDAMVQIDHRSAILQQYSGIHTIATGVLEMSAGGIASLNAGGIVTIAGSVANINTLPPIVLPVLPPEFTSPRGISSPGGPKKAEYPDANTILDHLTSEREAPDFPENANKLNADEMSRYENEGGTVNPKAKARAASKTGAGSPITMGQSFGSIGDSGNVAYDGANKTRAIQSPFAIPSSTQNSADKLSNLITVGMLPGLSRCGATNNGLSRKDILTNASHLAVNILDPFLAKWGDRMRITDFLRLGNGSSNHYSGKAVDLGSMSRNFAETAEAAKWIMDNLPFDRLFLEANHERCVHIHVEAAPAGATGARTVWTCGDPKCYSRTNGLQLSFAVQGLKRMGLA